MATNLDVVFDRAVSDVRTKVLAYAARTWNGLGAYRDSDAERFIRLVVPKVEAAQKNVAELTDAYLSRLIASQLGAPIKRGDIASATTVSLRGVEAEDVYLRPFASTYASLSKGKSVTDSIGSGAARLADLVSTGVQLSKTHAARQAMSRTRVELFQRFLTGRENCALCVLASTQRYHKGDLMPIHPGCDCGVRTFVGDPDVQVIAPELLDQTNAVIASKFAESGFENFSDLVVTHEHGEIGPLLAYRGEHFTGPGQIPG